VRVWLDCFVAARLAMTIMGVIFLLFIWKIFSLDGKGRRGQASPPPHEGKELAKRRRSHGENCNFAKDIVCFMKK
jgi:hypothetical protein